MCVGCFLLMAYIFAFNDWTDIALDSENSQKSRHTFSHDGITGQAMLSLAIALAATGILVVALISIRLILFAVLIVCFGVAYSFPGKGLKVKGIPILSSGLHFVGTALTFLMGAATFSPLTLDMLLIASYFGMLITAGHLVQEVQDYGDDRLAGVRTNAVRFGQRRVFVAAGVLFGLSFLYLIGLACAGLVTGLAQYTVVLYPLYVLWAIQVSRAGYDKDHVRGLRDRYRVLFGVVVVVILAGALAAKGALP
jgi:4-hydroxybenzoate polyprenyltransferase